MWGAICTGCVRRRCHDISARDPKTAGMDWTDVLAVEAENKRQRLAAELLASDVYASTAERLRRSSRKGVGAGRRFLITSVIYFRR